MEKRALLAVILSIAVFYIFSMIAGPEKQRVPPPATSNPTSAAPVSVPDQTLKAQSASASVEPQTAPAQVPVKDITVETSLYKAVFSSRGGSLKSLTLKKHLEKNSPTANPVILETNTDPAVFTFSTRATGFDLSDSAVYIPDAESIKVSGEESRKLTFNYISGRGFTVRKVYTLGANSYGIKLDIEVINNSTTPLGGSIQQLMTYPVAHKIKDSRFEVSGSYVYADNSLKVDNEKDVLKASRVPYKNVQWAGFADKYFLTAILDNKGSIASVEVRKNTNGFLESIVVSPQFIVNSGQSYSLSYRLFVGPKDIDILKSQGNSLEQSLDLGWFSAIAKPLLYSLKFFYRYVGNYGIAIIIITIILKVLFFPLTHKSYKSMKDMQKIQPKMTALKEKYKNDRDGMNKAVMELYRENKVNPLGGCLPMIVQIPVFFALYKALMFSIELRHAPFFLWITDLSDKDPYYVTPVIMGVTMFIQQKMTPSQMDPVQQKMMLALPVVFTFMFLGFPSGLVLYWLVNNILTIGQQMYINKLVK